VGLFLGGLFYPEFESESLAKGLMDAAEFPDVVLMDNICGIWTGNVWCKNETLEEFPAGT